MWRLLVVLGIIGIASPALGQRNNSLPLACAPSLIQEQALREKYKEESVAFGVIDGGSLLAELWVSEENDTWTITLRTVEGTLCGVLTGKGWRDAPERVKGIRS